MKRLALVTVLAALALIVAQVGAAEPKVASNVLVKPTFLLANGSWSGGTAFLLRTTDRPETLLVTCHHLFGPATGLKEQMTSEDIAQNVCGAVGLSMQDRKTIVVAPTYLPVPGARLFDDQGTDKDLAVFVVQQSEKQSEKQAALELGEQMPQLGATVYVFARLRSATEPKLFPATVGRIDPHQLLYTFAENGIDLAGTSGAPVLDDKGHVVGINVGGGEQSGHLIGIANPATSFKAVMSSGKK